MCSPLPLRETLTDQTDSITLTNRLMIVGVWTNDTEIESDIRDITICDEREELLKNLSIQGKREPRLAEQLTSVLKHREQWMMGAMSRAQVFH